MMEVLAFWSGTPSICCIGVETGQLRGTVLTVVSGNVYKRERYGVRYDKSKEPYILHHGERLQFCEKEKGRLGI